MRRHSWARRPVDHSVFAAAYHFKVLPDRVRQTSPEVLKLCGQMNAPLIAPTIQEIEAMDERDRRWMIVYFEVLPKTLEQRAVDEAVRQSRKG